MPIYEYQCSDCGERIERLQRLDDPPPGACEECGGAMSRMISAPAFQFKGTGWYVTDYADRKPSDDSKSSSEPSKATAASESESGSGSEKSKSDSKQTSAATATSSSGSDD